MITEPLLPCPFCGRAVDPECHDTLYPSGAYWREENGFKRYIRHRDSKVGDGVCWAMHCPTTGGGCGVEMTGDSRAETVAKWNRRACSD